jgi:hypothetical protein
MEGRLRDEAPLSRWELLLRELEIRECDLAAVIANPFSARYALLTAWVKRYGAQRFVPERVLDVLGMKRDVERAVESRLERVW